MIDSFDPYYKWLGIKPKDQPPNHYRLLGVELFESDADVIENAADQRMRHIRSLQAGANAEASQRILNEIAVARVCLTDPVKRSEYDLQLQSVQVVSASVVPPAPPVMAAAAPPPVATVAPPKTVSEPARVASSRSSLPQTTLPSRPGAARQRPANKAKNGPPLVMLFIVGGVAGLLLLCGALLWAIKQQDQSTSLAPDKSPDTGSPPNISPPDHVPPVRPIPHKPPPVEPEKKPPVVRPTGELHLNSMANVTLQPGQPLRVQATVRDPDRWKGRVRFGVGLGNPTGVTVDPPTGWTEWNPPRDAQRLYMFNVEARSGADEDSASFQVELPWARGVLVLSNGGHQTAYPNEAITVGLSARDDVGPAEGIRFEVVKGPEGGTIDPQSGQWRWKPREYDLNQTRYVTVRATDARGVSATTSFGVSVQKKPPPEGSGGDKPKTDGKSADQGARPVGNTERYFVLQFDGNGYVATHWHYDGQTPLTIEALVRPTDLRQSAVLGCLHLAGVGLSLTADGHWAFVVRDGDHYAQIVSDQAAVAERRVHLAGVMADKKMRLFVNGEPQQQTQMVDKFVPSSHALLIGADTNAQGGAEAFFHGTISAVKASNRAIYSDKFQRPWSLTADGETSMLLVFDRGDGDEVRDRTGKTGGATIHGAHWVPREHRMTNP